MAGMERNSFEMFRIRLRPRVKNCSGISRRHRLGMMVLKITAGRAKLVSTRTKSAVILSPDDWFPKQLGELRNHVHEM